MYICLIIRPIHKAYISDMGLFTLLGGLGSISTQINAPLRSKMQENASKFML